MKALEEDREFRYAVMGLLGYREVLERITRLEERFARLEARQQRLEERQQRLEERFARLEERFLRLEERQQRLEERQQSLEERFARLEARQQRLEERFARLEERYQRLEASQRRLEEEVASVRRIAEYTRRDVGALAEAMYSRMAWEDISDEISARGEKVVSRRRGVRVDGYDIDLIIESETSVYVVEVKIQPNHHDVNELLEKSKAVERLTSKKAIPVLVGTWIGGELKEYCREKGVTVIEY